MIPRISKTIDEVCKLTGIPRHRVMYSRDIPDVRARWILFYAMRERGWKPLSRIFDLDHSTVMYGYRQAVALAERDPAYAILLGAVRDFYLLQPGPMEIAA